MARLLLSSLLALASLLAIQARQLSHSHGSPSSAEVFWRTVLPASPLPEAIHWLLHPDTNSESKAEAMNMGMAGDNNGETPSGNFFYTHYKRSSQSPIGDNSGGTPSENFFYTNYKRSSQSPVGENSAGTPSGNFFYTNYKGSSQSPIGDNSVGTPSGNFFYTHYKHSSMRRVAKQNKAVKGTVVFFHEEAIRVGETLPIHFPPAKRAPLGLLPRDVADSIPFTTSALPDVLARFGIPAGSQQAARMEETLGMCEMPSLAGEAKFCATSLEALLEGAMAGLGTRDIRLVTSTLPRSGEPLQPYTIRAVHPIGGSRFVACHDNMYPYTVYMCHDTGAVRAYMADMEAANGSLVTVAIVCHTDTSLWDPEHMSFKLLGTKPGGEPVCHFMPYGHILFAKNNATRSSA